MAQEAWSKPDEPHWSHQHPTPRELREDALIRKAVAKALGGMTINITWLESLGYGSCIIQKNGYVVQFDCDRETYERLQQMGFEEKT